LKHAIRYATAALLCAWPAAGQDQEQISVAVKVIEFQTRESIETGLSAYFKQGLVNAYGVAENTSGAITVADVTFPNSTTSGITVFLDRISNAYGNIELVLQALQDQNRAFILSRPRAMVPVGEATPTIIETVRKIPYEDTKVFGATAKQITSFRDAGVYLSVQAVEVVDDDGDRRTTNDTYIHLKVIARVNEEGQRFIVALDDILTSTGSIFNSDSNAISVPEFVSREITTDVWVTHGQVLILGGLYRNSVSRDIESVPLLKQTEDFVNAAADRIIPFSTPNLPVSASIGNRRELEDRRELVFLLRAERWLPSHTVANEFDFLEEDEAEEASEERGSGPTDVITDVLRGIGNIPRGVAGGIAGEAEDKAVNRLGVEP
jgi:hypothetical protein